MLRNNDVREISQFIKKAESLLYICYYIFYVDSRRVKEFLYGIKKMQNCRLRSRYEKTVILLHILLVTR